MTRSEVSLIALRRILRATELYGRDLARAAGLTAVQVRVLQILAETGRSTPKALAARMGVAQATMTTLIDRLVAKSLVERHRSQSDRRQVDITLTEAGRAALERAPDPLHDRYVKEFNALPDWEQAMIIAALERVASLLDAGHLDVAPVLDLGDIRRQSPGG